MIDLTPPCSLSSDALIDEVVSEVCRRDPAAAGRYLPDGADRFRRHAHWHLRVILAAQAVHSMTLLTDWLAWARHLKSGDALSAADTELLVTCLGDVLHRCGGSEGHAQAALLGQARAELDRLGPELRSRCCMIAPLGEMAGNYLGRLLDGDLAGAEKNILAAAAVGMPLSSIYLDVFAPVLLEVGARWYGGRLSEAQEHYVCAFTQMVMTRFYPHLFAAGGGRRVLLAACVEGEMHEIALRMVADLFQLAGWETHFVGGDTPSETVAQLVETVGADVVAVSAMMSQHVPAVAALVKCLRAQPRGTAMKIMVGGYPFTIDPDLWRRVGADATAPDALSAVTEIEKLLVGPRTATR